MSMSQLLAEIDYGISKLSTEVTHFQFYFLASLAALKAVFDQILEEYNRYYQLGISNKEILTSMSFRNASLRINNTQALIFIDFFDREKTKLMQDSRVSLLLASHNVRDQIIHRGPVSRDIHMTLTDSISMRFQDGLKRPLDATFFLSGHTCDDIPTLCQYCLNKLRTFVSLVETNFPR